MGLRKQIVATIVGGFSMWVVAGAWHNLIMPQLYADRHATHDGIMTLLGAYVVLAAFMTYLYVRGARGERPLVDGLMFGAIIGVLWVFPHELALAGAHSEPLGYVFKNAAWHAVEQSIGGAVIGLLIGRHPGGETVSRLAVESGDGRC